MISQNNPIKEAAFDYIMDIIETKRTDLLSNNIKPEVIILGCVYFDIIRSTLKKFDMDDFGTRFGCYTRIYGLPVIKTQKGEDIVEVY